MNAAPPVYAEGWSYEENDGRRSFRWMGREAVVRLEEAGPPGLKYLSLEASHMFPESPPPRLEVFVGGRKAGERRIAFQFAPYIFPFKTGGPVEVRLKVDRIYPVPGDGRDHGIMVSAVSVVSAAGLAAPFYAEGWQPEEKDDFTSFRWMRREARILLPASEREASGYVTIPVFSEFMNQTQILEVRRGGRMIGRAALLPKWTFFSFPLDPRKAYVRTSAGPLGRFRLRAGVPPAAAQETGPDELVLTVNKVYPRKYHAEDCRELGARVGPAALHSDPERHRDFVFFHGNALLNHREMAQGRTKLRSFPQNLGVDLYGRCNIKPPCVYCLWHDMKKLEGEAVDAEVDERTLESYGPLFDGARTLVNCSFGEPLLHPRFEEIVEAVDRKGKILELSTNGQAFTERTIRALAGKRVTLYISLDAATEETYAKLRNGRWTAILPQLRRLAEERRRSGDLPKIFMVFIPMRVNRGDLEAYIKLAGEIGADSVILRPLIHLENPKIESDRGGYHFDYAAEMLSREEMDEVAAEAERLGGIHGVQVQNQFNFGTFEEPGAKPAARRGEF